MPVGERVEFLPALVVQGVHRLPLRVRRRQQRCKCRLPRHLSPRRLDGFEGGKRVAGGIRDGVENEGGLLGGARASGDERSGDGGCFRIGGVKALAAQHGESVTGESGNLRCRGLGECDDAVVHGRTSGPAENGGEGVGGDSVGAWRFDGHAGEGKLLLGGESRVGGGGEEIDQVHAASGMVWVLPLVNFGTGQSGDDQFDAAPMRNVTVPVPLASCGPNRTAYGAPTRICMCVFSPAGVTSGVVEVAKIMLELSPLA